MLNTEAGFKAKSISWTLGAQMGTLSGALLPPRGTHSGGFAGDVRAWNLGPGALPVPPARAAPWASLSLLWDNVSLTSVHLLSQQGGGGPEPRRLSQVPGSWAASQGLSLICPK